MAFDISGSGLEETTDSTGSSACLTDGSTNYAAEERGTAIVRAAGFFYTVGTWALNDLTAEAAVASDFLKIGGTKYAATKPTAGIVANIGDTLEWYTASNVFGDNGLQAQTAWAPKAGFTICICGPGYSIFDSATGTCSKKTAATCPAGTFSDTTTQRCAKCPSGRWGSQANKVSVESACTGDTATCPAGSHSQRQPGATSEAEACTTAGFSITGSGVRLDSANTMCITDGSKKYAANQETTRILGEQLVEKATIDAFMGSQVEVETAEMRERWGNREREERARAQRAEERKAAELAKMDAWKAERDVRLTEEERAEKDADLERLRATLAREKAKDDYEEAERARHIAEQQEYQKHLLVQMQKEAEDDTELQRIMKQYEEEKWEKRERQWGAEREARERLMSEVFAGREQQQAHKKAVAIALAAEDTRFASMAKRKNVEANAAEDAKMAALQRKHLAYQDEILDQITAKEQREAARVADINAHHQSMLDLQETHRRKVDSMRTTEVAQVNFARKTGQWYF